MASPGFPIPTVCASAKSAGGRRLLVELPDGDQKLGRG